MVNERIKARSEFKVYIIDARIEPQRRVVTRLCGEKRGAAPYEIGADTYKK